MTLRPSGVRRGRVRHRAPPPSRGGGAAGDVAPGRAAVGRRVGTRCGRRGGRRRRRAASSARGRRRRRPRGGGGRPGGARGRGRARSRCRGRGRARRPVPSLASTVSSEPRADTATPARSRAAPIRAWASSPSTSTSRAPVASRNSSVREARSSRPPSRTTTWSLTRSSSPSRCEVTMTAMPKSRPIRRTRPSISSRAAGSRPLVGSSRRTRRGSWARAWASLAFCFIPVEYPPIGR